jgi:uncharacterized membrane protein required for colicin V production
VVTLDLILVVIFLLGALNGYRTGFVRQVMRLFGGVIAYLASYWLRPYMIPVVKPFVQNLNIVPKNAGLLEQTALGGLSGAVAFGIVFVVTFLLFRYAASLVDAIFRLPILSFLNRFCGFIAGILLAFIFSDVALYILGEIHISTITYQLSHSIVAGWILDEGKVAVQTFLEMRSAG